MILPIVSYGNSILKKKAQEIKADYPQLQDLIANMFETMYAANGVGLAAPQVNLNIRLFTVDASPFGEDDPDAAGFKKVFINPVITERSGEEVLFEEGCLSFPCLHEGIMRHPDIRIKYFDENFVEYNESYTGIRSRIIQHEYDHLEGILMVDHLSSLKKMILKRRLKEISVGLVEAAYKMRFAARP
jgi:peptide deformylase